MSLSATTIGSYLSLARKPSHSTSTLYVPGNTPSAIIEPLSSSRRVRTQLLRVGSRSVTAGSAHGCLVEAITTLPSILRAPNSFTIAPSTCWPSPTSWLPSVRP